MRTSLAARNGILVKDRLSLERSRIVDIVLFDKTGTLTRGEHVLTNVAGRDRDAVLAHAGAVEAESEHPLARAIVAAARERGPIPLASAWGAQIRAAAGRDGGGVGR
jgi:P-type Cu2+ transporter